MLRLKWIGIKWVVVDSLALRLVVGTGTGRGRGRERQRGGTVARWHGGSVPEQAKGSRKSPGY